MVFVVLFCFALYLASLVLLPVLVLGFVRRYGTGWRLFFAVAALQGLIYATILVLVLTDYPSAAAIILPGIIAIAAALAGIVGLVLYTLLFFLIYRPGNWKRNSIWVTALSALAILAYAAPRLIAKSGVTTNVDLHGIVTDIDGQPVPNAEVHFGNCSYLQDPVPVTDSRGHFQVVANCRGYLIIDRIRNRETGTDCQSWYPSSSENGLMVFNSHGATLDSVRNPGWANHPAENPVMIPCVWRVPDTVRHHMGGHDEFPVDGRTVTFAPAPRGQHLDDIDGEHEGLFHVEFLVDENEPTDSSLPATGRLRISPVSGGIQVTEDYEPFNAAPTEGYQPYVELTLEDTAQKIDESFYFYGDDRRVYGSLRVWMNYSYDYAAQALTSRLRIRLDTYVNDTGSRVLLTHKVVYR